MPQRITAYIFLISLAVSQEPDTTYFIRYFNSDHDFMAGKTISAGERNKTGYLQVDYKEEERPIRKQWITGSGKGTDETLLYYNENDELKKQAWLDETGHVWRMEYYGEKEPWSREFRLAAYPQRDKFYFDGQKTRFTLGAGGQVQQIEFFTITGENYGMIRLEYDYHGLLSNEAWTLMPDNLVFRKFVYEVNLLTNSRKIWEYGRHDALISHGVLEMAPEDELYLTPPPRTGNKLDEANEILTDIKKSIITVDIPAMIPKMEHDMLYLLSGKVYEIEIISIDNSEFRFREKGSEDILTIPIGRVQKIVSRWGNLVYPH